MRSHIRAVTGRNLAEAEPHAHNDLLAPASGLPPPGNQEDKSPGFKVVDWVPLHHTMHELGSLYELPKTMESAALYGPIREKLERMRGRLVEGLQAPRTTVEAAAAALQKLCSEQPAAPGCSNEVISVQRDQLANSKRNASLGTAVSVEAAPDATRDWQFEGVVTPLPAHIQEQIQKNLQIEQAILEHKLLMQQLALNKQIEELNRELGVDEWIDLWMRLGPQVSDQPVPEETKDDTESSELLAKLASRYPQLFEEEPVYSSVPQQAALSAASAIHAQMTDGEGPDNSGGADRMERDKAFQNRASVTSGTYWTPPLTEAAPRSSSPGQNHSASLRPFELNGRVAVASLEKGVVAPAQKTVSPREVQADSRVVQSITARSYAAPAGNPVQQSASYRPLAPGRSTETGSAKVRDSPHERKSNLSSGMQPCCIKQAFLQNISEGLTSVAQVLLSTLRRPWFCDGPLQALVYEGQETRPVPAMPSLRGVSLGTRPVTGERQTDSLSDEKTAEPPPINPVLAGFFDSPTIGWHPTGSPVDGEGGLRQEVPRIGPLSHLIEALREIIIAH
ncbi:hypothetical protein BESB_052180 [Besnoitia besnoiti]|uniref:Uncharacterized protein n=1 Tax=Besnoitia besnoiti TaxID=94643 RepID=A0A2A9MIZ7_BESBE|nr:hypothetical protein BESB_052180 [Besnoitia besnoiti]PFH35567.1 hypothetical protein BESB_052180 [Besnoitia besnoiti]